MECQSLPKMFVIVGWINSPLGPYFPCRETVLAWPFLPYVPSSCIHPVRTFKNFQFSTDAIHVSVGWQIIINGLRQSYFYSSVALLAHAYHCDHIPVHTATWNRQYCGPKTEEPRN